MNGVVTWLKEQEYVKVERQTCGSNGLEKEVVEAIEVALDKETLTEKRSSVQVSDAGLLFRKTCRSGMLRIVFQVVKVNIPEFWV